MDTDQEFSSYENPATSEPAGTDFSSYEASEMARDQSMRGVGFDKPAPDPDAVSITVNRITPVKPVKPLEPTVPEPPTGGLIQPESSFDNSPPPPANDSGHRGGKKKWWLWLLILLLVAIAAGYLAADDGLVRGGSHLPYHFFSKYKKSSSTTSNNTTTSTSPAVPSGFSQYQLQSAHAQFDAPTSWGTPSFSSDPGYSARGGANKSNGTHAYLVSFASNKDVQVALTNGSLLPANATDSRYYDFLGWCTGSIDQQYYLQRLVFYTDINKVDYPGTVSCDQGPLTNVTKINNSTVEMAKVKDSSGQVIGNIYVDNLTGNPQAVVLRVLDTNMQNDTDIKTLLSTIQNI